MNVTSTQFKDLAVVAKIAEILTLNNITASVSDYVIRSVSAAIYLPHQSRGNTVLVLAPVVGNSGKPVLHCYYDRVDIKQALDGLSPTAGDLTTEDSVADIMDAINESLHGDLVLRRTDFYDTYAYVNGDEQFIELHARPDSLFYTGAVHITSFKPTWSLRFKTKVI